MTTHLEAPVFEVRLLKAAHLAKAQAGHADYPKENGERIVGSEREKLPQLFGRPRLHLGCAGPGSNR